jgi:class 3 adenylate cyclase/CHASE2 domain-containing sensor protein
LKLKASSLAPLWIAIGVILAVCAVRVVNPEIPERLELLTYDIRVRQGIKFSPGASDKFGFIYIDEQTLDAVREGGLGYRFGLYWPRQVYGRALSELTAQGVKAAALDVIFAEPRPDHPPVQMADGSLVESDEYFARQWRLCSNAVLALNGVAAPPALFLTNAHWKGDISTERDSDGILRRARAFRIYREWHPVFRQLETDPEFGVDLNKVTLNPSSLVLNRQGAEAITIPLDSDGKFDLADFIKVAPGEPRKALPFSETRVWHMGIVLAAIELGIDLDRSEVDLERGVIRLKGATERTLFVDKEARFFVDWSLTPNDPRLKRRPLEQLLRQNKERLDGKDVTPEWKDKLVVIGSAAVMGNDLADRGATPFSPDTLLVSKHWNVANSILLNRFVRRTSLGMDAALILLLGLLAAFFTWRLRAVSALLVVILLATAYAAVCAAAYVHYRFWLPVVYPVGGALLMTHICLVTWRVVFEQADKRRVAAVLATIVSPKIARELLRAEKLELGGTRREITILFADVRGFTELTDSTQAEAEDYIRQKGVTGADAENLRDEQARATLSTVNRYLGAVADVIVTHDGTLDKFIGDCVMAFWGAPTPAPAHASVCVRAAIEAQRAIHRLNVEREELNRRLLIENKARESAGLRSRPLLPVLALGTGINTGMATVGLMGSEVQTVVRQGNYTVFGREVNLASRLESLSGKGRIFISESTYQHLLRDDPDTAKRCAALAPVAVKGIRNAVQVYEVPWMDPSLGAKEVAPEPASAGTAGYACCHATGADNLRPNRLKY